MFDFSGVDARQRAPTRVNARSVSAEYVSHVFKFGVDARSLNEPLGLVQLGSL
jgi:hypothetical protein